MVTFLSDASEVGSCAHQLMVSVRFYWILFFCHELMMSVRFIGSYFFVMMAIFRSSFLMSGHPVTPPRRTLARFQRLGFNASLTTFIFYFNDVLFLNISSSVAFLGSYT